MTYPNELEVLCETIGQLIDDGNYKEVINNAEYLVNKGIRHADMKAVLFAHYTCAVSYSYIGDIEKLFSHIEAHHKYCQSHGTKADWMRSYYLQYFISSVASDFKQGKKFIGDVLSIALETDHFTYVSIAYNKLSHILNQQKQYTEALHAAQCALEYADTYANKRKILSIQAHLHIIESAINLKQSELAMSSIDHLNAIEYLQKFPREKELFKILKGRLYELLGQPAKALHFYSLAIKQYELRNDYVLLKDIQQKRVALAEHFCTFDELAIIQKEYIDLLHEVENKNWVKTALELNIRLQTQTNKTSENIDYLTGVYNRKFLEETTNRWLINTNHTKETIVCAVFDIDNLKAINDTHGHLVGDEVIKLVAQVCSREIRKDHLLGRFGGDEFVLVMQGISLDQAKTKASQLAQKVEEVSSNSKEIEMKVTISVGLSDNVTREVNSFKDLFHLADLALYQAKKNGKNQVVSFI
ncbi:GGDEF domain-containing protein [Sporosarcina sp. GW1-11]|uniref:GGDEF domain-containing protein n=1 Tax=Sporosarcina sp. GW1-11 TaxID=2899126 RepID=UPI00294BF38F|nr:GGDEF domain-containing protein [Sporosarcina sp. GW1-11]MDV6379062.1 GGDEF domain-containing protein [Sporosarcina sp. GW1-11]